MWTASVSFEVKLLNVLKRDVKTFICEEDRPTVPTNGLWTPQQLQAVQCNAPVCSRACCCDPRPRRASVVQVPTSAPSNCIYSSTAQALLGGRDSQGVVCPSPRCVHLGQLMDLFSGPFCCLFLSAFLPPQHLFPSQFPLTMCGSDRRTVLCLYEIK